MPPGGESSDQYSTANQQRPLTPRRGVDGFGPRRPYVGHRAAAPLSPPAPVTPTMPAPTQAAPIKASGEPVNQLQPTSVVPSNSSAPVMPLAPLSFEPPVTAPKTRKLLPKIIKFKPVLAALKRSWRRAAVVGVVLLVMTLLAAGGRHLLVAQKPDHVLQSALSASLTATQVQITTNGAAKSQSQLDVSDQHNPTATSTATIILNGQHYGVTTYGTAKNTYTSYTALSSATEAAMINGVKQSWVQLRANGQLPAGVPQVLTNQADPRYLAFGPVLLGNITAKDRSELLAYVLANRVYEFNERAVTKEQLNGQAVLRYPLKMKVGYLKIAMQTIANNEGFGPDEVAAASNALDNLKQSDAALYVSKGGHKIVRFAYVKNGQTTTYDYQWGTGPQGSEPQTHLQWKDFASRQWQLEAAVASKQSASQLDATRKSHLTAIQQALEGYFSVNSFYPSAANLNDQTWVGKNLPLLDVENFRDPLGNTPVLLPTTKVGSVSYQALPASGTGACDNLTSICAHYQLVTVLSNNQPLVLHD